MAGSGRVGEGGGGEGWGQGGAGQAGGQFSKALAWAACSCAALGGVGWCVHQRRGHALSAGSSSSMAKRLTMPISPNCTGARGAREVCTQLAALRCAGPQPCPAPPRPPTHQANTKHNAPGAPRRVASAVALQSVACVFAEKGGEPPNTSPPRHPAATGAHEPGHRQRGGGAAHQEVEHAADHKDCASDRSGDGEAQPRHQQQSNKDGQVFEHVLVPTLHAVELHGVPVCVGAGGRGGVAATSDGAVSGSARKWSCARQRALTNAHLWEGSA